MKHFTLIALLALLPLMKASAQETPNKPDVWKSAGTHTASPAAIQALIDTPGPALIIRTQCRALNILWGTDTNADVAAARLVEIGSPAIDIVLPLLNDKEMWRRRLAVEILGRIGNRRVTPALLTLLKTEIDSRVRQSLTESLAMLRDPHAENTLIQATHDTDYLVQYRAAQGLAWLKSRRAIAALTSLLILPADINAAQSDASSLANKSSQLLCETGSGTLSPMLHILNNPNTTAPTLALAVAPAAATGNNLVLPILLRLLEHPDDTVRNAAVLNLRQWDDARIFPAIVQVLHGAKGQAQDSAGRLLANIGSAEALDALAIATEDPDDNVRLAASYALPYLTDHSATPLLLHLLQTGRKNTPEYAAAALGNVQDESAIPALTATLTSSSIDLRVAAANALTHFNNAQSIGALVKALDDSNKDVRVIALRALRNKHDDRLLPAFTRLSKDADQDIQRLAVNGILWQQAQIQKTSSQ